MTKQTFFSLALGTLMTGTVAAGAQALPSGGGSSQNPNLPSQSGMIPTQNNNGQNTMPSPQDKDFLMQASLGDYTEITFSKLALQKSSNADVKAYAQKMITDHTKLDQAMQPQASMAGVTPPTALDAEHQQLYDQMSQLSGTDFDKQYMTAMDKDHHKTLDAFKAEVSSTHDSILKPIVEHGQSVVAQHTKMADKMVSKMGASSNGI